MSARRIELIVASAGTGKTTRLARVLEDALVSGQVRPHAVLATTFTRQAAAELAERARTRLLSVGRHEDAHRLQAARIGTVNAVCGALVEEFAFDLGLSPQVRVVDEGAAARMLRQTISRVATVAQGRRLSELSATMTNLDWQIRVAEIVAAARANNIPSSALTSSRDRSRALAQQVLGTPDPDGAAIDARLVTAMRTLVDTIGPDAPLKGAKTARTKCQQDLVKLEGGRPLPWSRWASIANEVDATKTYRTVASAVEDAAAAHDRHPALHRDVLDAIDLVFDLAAQTLDAYAEYKRAHGVIDFADQEAYALQLLGRPDVAERLAEQLDLVMVDEFQDTSPLQLAIFLKLAEIAPRSVWVGDEKQSIYGFRGTDPDLMNATLALLERRDPQFVDDTLAALFEETTPETLHKSWRSRPALVELTSHLFAEAFARHGIPRERVTLEAGEPTEPAGLGDIVECWDLQIPNRRHTTKYPLAVAAGVHALLDRGDVRVRDPATGEARPVTLADIAVLSRRRGQSQLVATALEGLGRRVVLARPGLLGTPEGRMALAALRRWADPRDALAAAEIDRLVLAADDPDVLIERLLDPNGTASPTVARLDAARAARPTSDPLAALLACIDAVGLRDLCRGWGEARQRLANLDALHSHAQAYVDQQASELGPCSVPGLLAYIEGLPDDKEDAQAVLAGDDAITLSTWHAAKGLEWPITIFFDLQWDRGPDVAGVEVEPTEGRLELRDPLADRWIRFLPQPFLWNQNAPPLLQRAAKLPAAQRAHQRAQREQLRLLYVAWTRARDRLVLAGDPLSMYDKILAQLSSDTGPLLQHPLAGKATWGGRKLDVPVHKFSPLPPHPRDGVPGHVYPPREPKSHPPAWLLPSQVDAPGDIVAEHEVGEAFEITGVDPRRLGDAVHALLAADDASHDVDAREAFAAEILERFGVARDGLAAHLVGAADALRAFVTSRFDGPTLRREHPVWHELPSGTVIRGVADLVVEHAGGFAVVDHKALIGGLARARSEALGYAGQLGAYAQAIAGASGREVTGLFVHLPLLGRVLEVRAGE